MVGESGKFLRAEVASSSCHASIDVKGLDETESRVISINKKTRGHSHLFVLFAVVARPYIVGMTIRRNAKALLFHLSPPHSSGWNSFFRTLKFRTQDPRSLFEPKGLISLSANLPYTKIDTT